MNHAFKENGFNSFNVNKRKMCYLITYGNYNIDITKNCLQLKSSYKSHENIYFKKTVLRYIQ